MHAHMHTCSFLFFSPTLLLPFYLTSLHQVACKTFDFSSLLCPATYDYAPPSFLHTLVCTYLIISAHLCSSFPFVLLALNCLILCYYNLLYLFFEFSSGLQPTYVWFCTKTLAQRNLSVIYFILSLLVIGGNTCYTSSRVESVRFCSLEALAVE